MKLKGLFLLVTMGLVTVTGCSDDGSSPIPSEPVSNNKSMNVSATVSPLVEVNTRAKILNFEQGHTIGVFYNDTSINRPFIYQNAGSWSGAKINLADELKNVYGYFPYDKTATNIAAIPVNIAAQNDVLFGTAIVSKESAEANIAMKHALSLVRMVIKKNDYTGAGVINSVTWNNIAKTATMDCTTGNLANAGGVGSLQVGGGYTLDDSKDPIAVEAILLPVSSAGGISVTVQIDGKNRTYNISETHSFEQGKAYTYTLLLTADYNTPVSLDECDVDVTYWSSFGKTDTVVLGTSDVDFFAVSP